MGKREEHLANRQRMSPNGIHRLVHRRPGLDLAGVPAEVVRTDENGSVTIEYRGGRVDGIVRPGTVEAGFEVLSPPLDADGVGVEPSAATQRRLDDNGRQ
jgi:hypothetical protein